MRRAETAQKLLIAFKPPGRSDLSELKLKGGDSSDGYPPHTFLGVELPAM